MRHLRAASPYDADIWCDAEGEVQIAEEPDHCDCVDCLRRAGMYGAKAAMRCAALEAGASRDPELQQERDAALKKLNTFMKALEDAGGFFCQGCESVLQTKSVGFEVGRLKWCKQCKEGA